MEREFGQLSSDLPHRQATADEMSHNRLLNAFLDGSLKSDMQPQLRLPNPKAAPGTPEQFHQLQNELQPLEKSMWRRQANASNAPDTAPISLNEFADRALNLFDTLDSDRNGFVSKRELGHAIGRFDIKGKDAQALAALYTNIAQPGVQNTKAWKLGDSEGISRQDLWDLKNKLQWGDTIHADLKEGLTDTIQSVANSQQVACRRLFSDATDPLKSINPLAIRQGSVNDCYFESSLSSLAATNPQAIKDMIQPMANGHYKVTFPGDPAHPVTVSRPTEAEAGLYNHASRFGTWARVMEKAYGEYIRARGHDSSTALTAQDSLNNGMEKSAMKLLTGNNATTFPASRDLSLLLSERGVDQRELADTITKALTERRLVAAATTSRKAKEYNGYLTDHAHAILAFDRTAPDGGTLLIYNPAGKLTTLSLKKFMQTFADVTTESRHELKGPCTFDKVNVNCAG